MRSQKGLGGVTRLLGHRRRALLHGVRFSGRGGSALRLPCGAGGLLFFGLPPALLLNALSARERARCRRLRLFGRSLVRGPSCRQIFIRSIVSALF